MPAYIYHYTYLITNLSPKNSERYYIGVRSCNCLPEMDPYMSSSKSLNADIHKYGSQNFEKIIIEIWESRNKALAHEIWLHNEYDVAINELFYNKAKQTCSGFDITGCKRIISEERKIQLSLQTKGIPKSEEHKRKISESQKNKKISNYTKQLLSEYRGIKSSGFIGWYITPWGKYDSIRNAINDINYLCSGETLRKWCRNNYKVITPRSKYCSKYLKSLNFDPIGKTFKDLGFSFQPVDN